MFSIGRLELLAMAVVALCAFALAWVLGRVTQSSERLAVAVSAVPIPALGCAISLWAIVAGSRASAEECGVDGCGLTIAAGLTVLVLSVVALFLGALLARIGFRMGRR